MRGCLCAVWLVSGAALAQPTPCRQICFPDEIRGTNGCCVPSPRASEPNASPDVGCPLGQTRTDGTAGHCCWPGQSWETDRCRGQPTHCPPGMLPDPASDACQPAPCPTGQRRMDDGVTCCWPGQSLEGTACHGLPTACPRDAIPTGDDCVARPGAKVGLSTPDATASYQVKVQSASGELSCAEPVTSFRACELRGVTPGKARVSVSTQREAKFLDLQREAGTVTFDQDVEVVAPKTLFTIQHRDYSVELGTGVAALATLTFSLVAAAAPCRGYQTVTTQPGGSPNPTYNVLQATSSVCPGWVTAAVVSGIGTGALGYWSLTRIGHHDEVVPASETAPAKGGLSGPSVSLLDGHGLFVGATVTY